MGKFRITAEDVAFRRGYNVARERCDFGEPPKADKACVAELKSSGYISATFDAEAGSLSFHASRSMRAGIRYAAVEACLGLGNKEAAERCFENYGLKFADRISDHIKRRVQLEKEYGREPQGEGLASLQGRYDSLSKEIDVARKRYLGTAISSSHIMCRCPRGPGGTSFTHYPLMYGECIEKHGCCADDAAFLMCVDAKDKEEEKAQGLRLEKVAEYEAEIRGMLLYLQTAGVEFEVIK